jgi:hypothetical protein
MYIRKPSTELSWEDCRDLKRACTHAGELGRPLNTLVTFAPYPGSLPTPAARAVDFNRLLSHLRGWINRKLGESLVALWVWHSDVTGRNPHVHIFMHCMSRRRDELNSVLVANYPAGVIDVTEGSHIRKRHHSGYLGSTLDYLCRFKSQQAWWADKETFRQSIRDDQGRRRGIKSPITGKRWGSTRNISPSVVEAHLAAKSEARAAALLTQRKSSEAATSAREAA